MITQENLVRTDLSFFDRQRVQIRYFTKRLIETPLLLGWLAAGLVITFLLDGWVGLGFGLINMVLISLYVLLIRGMTPDAQPSLPVKRPRLELALGLALLGLLMVVQLFDFNVWNLQPYQGLVRGFFGRLQQGVYGLDGLPTWAVQDVFVAVSSTVKQLIPFLLLFLVLGYNRQSMGLVRPHWKLTAVLVGSAAVIGLASGILLRAPLIQFAGLYLIGILVNALPEELFFRGFLLARLEKLFANPLNALVISALLFNLVHVPIELSRGASPLTAVLGIFATGYPSGLIWGYLYLRTRSIIPGVLWHAANVQLGFILMSL